MGGRRLWADDGYGGVILAGCAACPICHVVLVWRHSCGDSAAIVAIVEILQKSALLQRTLCWSLRHGILDLTCQRWMDIIRSYPKQMEYRGSAGRNSLPRIFK